MTSGKSNIILIGMAGSGKSAVGRRLAEMLRLSFVDSDDLIVRAQGRPLQEIIDSLGMTGFQRIEEDILLGINLQDHVIATGGSTIYSTAGMAHLRDIGHVVLLQVDLALLQARVDNGATRGLVKRPEQSFAELYLERLPFYRKYAEYIYECGEQNIDTVCRGLVSLLRPVSSGSPG